MFDARFAWLTVLASLTAAGAVACNSPPYDPPPVPYVAKPIAGLHPRTTKAMVHVAEPAREVCPLIGDVDLATGRPLPVPTGQDFGLAGTDLGISVERDGKLFFLFGDSWHTSNIAREEGADAFGIMDARTPLDEACRSLSFATLPSDHGFDPITLNGQVLPTFDVPTGAFATPHHLYAFFTVMNADGYTIGDKGGRGVLGRSDGDGHFTWVRDVSPTGDRFNLVSAATVHAVHHDLPDEWAHRDLALLYGAGRYRESFPRLALAMVNHPQHPWIYFAGYDKHGAPAWTDDELSSMPLFLDYDAQKCVGEMSVAFAPHLGSWVMTYNCGGQIVARTSPKPWGPWSGPVVLFDVARDGWGKFIHHPCGYDGFACGDSAYSPARDDHFGPGESGWAYGPYLVPQWFSSTREGTEDIVFTMSTWNPYVAVLMRATLAS
jgi:hypothetical protein